MSGVKHTPDSGVHPDNTALRAVDACGGCYTPAEEASGWADGHRAALASAMVAVGRADSITADLLEALESLVEHTNGISLPVTAHMMRNRARDALARTRGEQDGGA